MSHELRTPLNAIIGFTGTLLMKLPGPLTDEQERQLQIVDSSARHLLSLINDILDVAKIESGKTSINPESVAIAEVMREVADSLRAMAEEKRLQFDVDVPIEPLVVATDRRALHQILLNLTNNAIKYTERGSVRVETHSERDGCVTVTVRDTGSGIRAEDRARLFQAFEQLDASSTRRFEGVGLGLHLSQRLASLIGVEPLVLMPDHEVVDETAALYRDNADWAKLIPSLADAAIKTERYERAFRLQYSDSVRGVVADQTVCRARSWTSSRWMPTTQSHSRSMRFCRASAKASCSILAAIPRISSPSFAWKMNGHSG